MEIFWRILRVLDWIYYWRLNVCFWAGVVLAVGAFLTIPWRTPALVVGGLLFLTMLYVGGRWQARRNRD